MPGLEITHERSWHNFLEASLKLYAKVNRRLVERHNLSLVDVRLLEILAKSQSGSARMGELAGRLTSLPSRVTRQIRRLEEAGLVEREASPDDGRGVLAAITDAGRAAVDEAMETYAGAVRDYFVGPLSRAQIFALGENCRRIATSLGSEVRFGRS